MHKKRQKRKNVALKKKKKKRGKDVSDVVSSKVEVPRIRMGYPFFFGCPPPRLSSVFVVFEYYVVSITSYCFAVLIRLRAFVLCYSLSPKAPSSSSRGVLVVFLPLCCVLLFYRMCFYVTRRDASSRPRAVHTTLAWYGRPRRLRTRRLASSSSSATRDDDRKPSREARGKIERPAMPTRLTKPFHASLPLDRWRNTRSCIPTGR